MYRSEQHRIATEGFISRMRANKYAESTIYRNILDTSDRIKESLPGNNNKDKARQLYRLINNQTTTETEAKSELQWDDRVVIPIGTIVNAHYGKSNPYYYKFVRIENNNYIILNEIGTNLVRSSNYNFSYRISDFNHNLKSHHWVMYNVTDEYYKIVTKPKPQIFNIKLSSSKGDNIYTVDPIGRGSGYRITYSPTNNCQVMVLANANVLITQKSYDTVDALREIYRKVGKNQVLIDINRCYLKNFEERIPKEAIVFNTPYSSTNSSNMNMILINLKKL